MSRIKPITEISDEDLLAALDQSEPDNTPTEYKNDLYDFISVYQLKDGKFEVSHKLLFKLYKKWSNDPVKQEVFKSELTIYFNTRQTQRISYFQLNIHKNMVLYETLNFFKKVKKTKSKNWKQHFDNYLKLYKIKSGTFYVKDSILYNLYDKWTYKINKHNPLSYGQFCQFFKLLFKSKKIEGHQWFAVDKSIIEHLNEDHKNELLNREKEENKKISS